MPRAGGRGTKLKGWARMRALGPAKSLGRDSGVLQGKTPRPTMEALGPKRPLRKPQGLLAYRALVVVVGSQRSFTCKNNAWAGDLAQRAEVLAAKLDD